MTDSQGPNRRGTIGGIIVAAIVLALGIWVFRVLDESQKAQACLESGRRNCAAIDVPQRR